MTLYYRGSTDGWMPENFHKNCDEKGATLTLLQIEDGDCIGCFTNESWSSIYQWKTDSGALLLNLSRSKVKNMAEK